MAALMQLLAVLGLLGCGLAHREHDPALLQQLRTLYLPLNYTGGGDPSFHLPSYNMENVFDFEIEHWKEYNLAAVSGLGWRWVQLVDLANPDFPVIRQAVPHLVSTMAHCGDHLFVFTYEPASPVHVYKLLPKLKTMEHSHTFTRRVLGLPASCAEQGCAIVGEVWPVGDAKFTSDCSKMIIGTTNVLMDSLPVLSGEEEDNDLRPAGGPGNSEENPYINGAWRSEYNTEGFDSFINGAQNNVAKVAKAMKKAQKLGAKRRQKRGVAAPERDDEHTEPTLSDDWHNPSMIYIVNFPGGILPDDGSDIYLRPVDLRVTIRRYWELFYQGFRLRGIDFGFEATSSSITVLPDDSRAIVQFDHLNGIAFVDLYTRMPISLQALGLKDWGECELDTSNVDGGIKFWSPKIYSPFMYRDAVVVQRPRADLLITANTRSATETLDWFHFVPGWFLFYLDGVDVDPFKFSIPLHIKEPLGDPKRLAYTRFDPYYQFTKPFVWKSRIEMSYQKLVLASSRSFTVWKIGHNQLTMLYDSGSELERRTAQHKPELFGLDIEEYKPEDNRLKFQDFNTTLGGGAAPTAIEVLPVYDMMYVFVGTMQGSVLVFSMYDHHHAGFESLNYCGELLMQIDDAYEQRKLGDGPIRDLSIIEREHSGLHRPVLVTGALQSLTMTMYEIGGLEDPGFYAATGSVDIYVDGIKLATKARSHRWRLAHHIDLYRGFEHIAVRIDNVPYKKDHPAAGFRGFLMAVSSLLCTHGQWKCTAKPDHVAHDWFKPDYHSHHWPKPRVTAVDDNIYHFKNEKGYTRNAAWIWADNVPDTKKGEKCPVYCRFDRDPPAPRASWASSHPLIRPLHAKRLKHAPEVHNVKGADHDGDGHPLGGSANDVNDMEIMDE